MTRLLSLFGLMRVSEHEAEVSRLRKLAAPEWFWLGDDCSSDRCRSSIWEVIDEDWLFDNRAEGAHVVEIAAATRCPTIWAGVRFFSETEKDERQDDEDYEIVEFSSFEEAVAWRDALAMRRKRAKDRDRAAGKRGKDNG